MNASTPKNVLFIICDDLNDWVYHPTDHPQVKTPHLDRLFSQSAVFMNAHAAVPVCGPARKCLFSGLYPQRIDSYAFESWNEVPALESCSPIPLHFKNNGYSVYGTGKLLHEGEGGPFYHDFGHEVDYGPHPWTGMGDSQFTPHPAQYDQWEGYLKEWDMHRDLNFGRLSQVPEWKADAQKGFPGAKGWYYRGAKPFHYKNDQERDPMPDEISIGYAKKRLEAFSNAKKRLEAFSKERSQNNSEQPFFLGVGLTKPHTPLYVPDEYYDRFPIEEVTLPPTLLHDLDDCADILKNRWSWGFEKFRALIDSGGVEAWKAFTQAYLATIAFVDDQIGELMATLEQTQLHDDTIVVFTSDNGYHVGEKECIQKWHLWNESTRLPLSIKIPGVTDTGIQIHHPVSHIDIYPTLIDLCNLPNHPHGGDHLRLDGNSLIPLIRPDKANPWQGTGYALTCIKDEGEPPHFSICSTDWRYTLCSNGEEELYDHANDPHEWHNLSQTPRHQERKTKMRSDLLTLLMDTHQNPKSYTSCST